MERSLVLLKSGETTMAQVYISRGAALIGDPTCFFIGKNDEIVWVKPGESVQFIEV